MKADAWLLLAAYSLTVVYRAWWFSRRARRLPLRNGDRYFMEVEVPEGWHSSEEGRTWWRRYWASIAIPHILEVIGFTAIAVWGRWKQLPLLALMAPVFVVFSIGFVVWWRKSSGADRYRPARVAVALEERRLSGYFFWPAETLMAALVVGSWAVLLLWGDAETRWRTPLTSTYVIAGFGLMKARVVKRGWALPVERTREYQAWHDRRRKQAAQVFDSFRWFLTVILSGYAAVHALGGIVPVEQARWSAIAAAVALCLWMMVSIARSDIVLDRASAGLPPPAMSIEWKKGWWSFGLFMAGLGILLIWPWR